MKVKLAPSEFKNLKGIEYFKFEEDFIEENVRCIPMIVRFKMDLAGIKLKLAEWSKFQTNDRVELALLPAGETLEILMYRSFLLDLIAKYTGKPGTNMAVDEQPEWGNLKQIPSVLKEKLLELKIGISIAQWQKLTAIQRFALLKLCRPGHENKNFPKAMVEFGLLSN